MSTGDEDAVTVRAVASTAGITAPAIYKHFADKSELVYAVCQRAFAALDAHVEAAAAGIDDPLLALKARGQAYVAFSVEKPEHYRILFMNRPASAPPQWTPEALMDSAAFEHLVDAVRRCFEAGSLPAGREAFLVAVGLWTGVHGVASLRISMPDFPWPPLAELVDHVLTTQARGLGARI